MGECKKMDTSKLSRSEMRKIAMEALYQHLLMDRDIRQAVFDITHSNQIDGYLYALTMGTVEHEQELTQKLQSMLRSDWSVDRLSKLDLAILLMSMQEILYNETPKPVVINEAVTLARKYSDEDSYKLINGILDQL